MISIDLSKLKDVFSMKNHTHSKNDITNLPTVATSGDYSDLDNAPEMDTVEVVITYTDDSEETINMYIEPSS